MTRASYREITIDNERRFALMLLKSVRKFQGIVWRYLLWLLQFLKSDSIILDYRKGRNQYKFKLIGHRLSKPEKKIFHFKNKKKIKIMCT